MLSTALSSRNRYFLSLPWCLTSRDCAARAEPDFSSCVLMTFTGHLLSRWGISPRAQPASLVD